MYDERIRSRLERRERLVERRENLKLSYDLVMLSCHLRKVRNPTWIERKI